MSNIKNKIGESLSKIQSGLDKGKNKVDLLKETSKYNKLITETNDKKSQVLLEVGTIVYEKVREGIIDDEDIIKKCKSIIGFDYIIYENKRKIDQITRLKEGIMCQCSNIVSYEDKFCCKCGNKIELPSDNISYTICKNCDMNVDIDSNFCPCCGIKM